MHKHGFTCRRSKMAAEGLVKAGLIQADDQDKAHEVISRILNVCEFCEDVLLPKEDPTYCDSLACSSLAAEGVDPDEHRNNND